jgi:hypothetical protein
MEEKTRIAFTGLVFPYKSEIGKARPRPLIPRSRSLGMEGLERRKARARAAP